MNLSRHQIRHQVRTSHPELVSIYLLVWDQTGCFTFLQLVVEGGCLFGGSVVAGQLDTPQFTTHIRANISPLLCFPSLRIHPLPGCSCRKPRERGLVMVLVSLQSPEPRIGPGAGTWWAAVGTGPGYWVCGPVDVTLSEILPSISKAAQYMERWKLIGTEALFIQNVVKQKSEKVIKSSEARILHGWLEMKPLGQPALPLCSLPAEPRAHEERFHVYEKRDPERPSSEKTASSWSWTFRLTFNELFSLYLQEVGSIIGKVCILSRFLMLLYYTIVV